MVRHFLAIVLAGKVRLPPGETLNINKKIKHISNWNFELKMVPVNAERFKLSKYMCVCPKRSFVARTGCTKVKLTPKIGAKIKKSFIKHSAGTIIYSSKWQPHIFCFHF